VLTFTVQTRQHSVNAFAQKDKIAWKCASIHTMEGFDGAYLRTKESAYCNRLL